MAALRGRLVACAMTAALLADLARLLPLLEALPDHDQNIPIGTVARTIAALDRLEAGSPRAVAR